MAEKRKIILDVDTGTDDAIAIMTAYLDPDIDLLAVCSLAVSSLASARPPLKRCSAPA